MALRKLNMFKRIKLGPYLIAYAKINSKSTKALNDKALNDKALNDKALNDKALKPKL